MSKTRFKREIKKGHMKKKLKKHDLEFSKEISQLERDVEKARKKICRKRLLEDIPWEERSRYKALLRARRQKKKRRIAFVKSVKKTKTQQQTKAENSKDSCSLNKVQESTKNWNSSILHPEDQRSPSTIAPDFPIIRDSSEITSKSESRKKSVKSVEETVNVNQQIFKENNKNSKDDKLISLTPTSSFTQISYLPDSSEGEHIRSTTATSNIVKNEGLLQVGKTRMAITIFGDTIENVSSGKKELLRKLSSDIKFDQNSILLGRGKSQRLPLRKVELNGAVNKNSKRTVIDLTSSPILSPRKKEDLTGRSNKTQKTVSPLCSPQENKGALRLGCSYTVQEIREIMRAGGGRFGRHKVRATLDFRKLVEPARASLHKHRKLLTHNVIRSLIKNGRFIKTIDRTLLSCHA